MDDYTKRPAYDNAPSPAATRRPSRRWLAVLGLVVAGVAVYYAFSSYERHAQQAPAGPPTAHVTVSRPLQQNLDRQLGFLGQFSAVNRVELRAQVGGTLTEIHFKDGQIVHKGDLLFVIDPRPYEVRLAQANAQLQTANSRVALTNAELTRAQSLKKSDFATQETVDQRTNDHSSSQAAIDDAKSRIQDAQLDLEYSRVTAPFTGRIGARQVSLGSLIAGSRAGVGPTTLLATLVSLDPVYLDFDMSESDYLIFARERAQAPKELGDKVAIALSDETDFKRQGQLDFVDNVLDRSSGTIHARATVPNPDLFLAPGQFARLRLAVSRPQPTLLLPDAAVTLDQSQQVVMTVNKDSVVTPKFVQTGDIRGGLRIIRSGLQQDDRVIISGLAYAMPGAKVVAEDGAIKFDAAAAGQD